LKLPYIALGTAVGQVGHHVGDNLVSRILAHVKRFRDGSDGMASVCIARDIFIDRLNANL
jgi:hypothetical protein